MNFSQDLIKGSIVPVVLKLLKERPMYGYEMVKVVKARTEGRFEWKEGTLYPALHRLEGEGLLTAKWKLAPTQKRRKYYYLTRKGRKALEVKIAELREFSLALNAIAFGGA